MAQLHILGLRLILPQPPETRRAVPRRLPQPCVPVEWKLRPPVDLLDPERGDLRRPFRRELGLLVGGGLGAELLAQSLQKGDAFSVCVCEEVLGVRCYVGVKCRCEGVAVKVSEIGVKKMWKPTNMNISLH